MCVVSVLPGGPPDPRGPFRCARGAPVPSFFQLRTEPGKERLGRRAPWIFGVARDLPLLPIRLHRLVELPAQGLQLLLVLLPDHVDPGVVGDGFQGDVRDPLVDEAVADVAVGGRFGRSFAGECGFLPLPFGAVREEVEGVAGAHDAGAGQGEGDAGGVDGDPAPAPLLGDVGGGAGAAGGVEDEITGVGGHEEAALNHGLRSLDDIGLICHKACANIVPSVCDLNSRKIV